MISVFKNFYQRPESLSAELLQEYAHSLIKLIEDDPSQELIKKVPRKFLVAYRHKDIKNALKKLYNNKCAFCEQKIDLEVEHYRPKSKYPWLLLEWSNLLPQCHKCSINVGNSFQLKGKELSWTDIQSSTNPGLINSPHLKRELPSLLNPEVDSPENHITFNLSGLAIGRTDRGRFTIDIVKLNRDDLIQKRKEAIQELKRELIELTTAFFGALRIKGDHIINNIPREFNTFFKKYSKCQEPSKEFSGLFKAIWEDNSFFANPYFSEEEYNLYIFNQLLIWKQLFTNNKQGLEKGDLSKISLTGFELQNYEGIKHIRLESLPISAQWIFLTGENGFGKTSVLKAIGLGLTGKKTTDNEARFIVNITSPTEIRIRKSVNENPMYDTWEYKWQSDKFKPFYKLAAYGPIRTTMSKNFSNPEEDDVLESLFGYKVPLLNVERFLIDTYGRRETATRYNTIVQVLLDVIPQLAGIRVDHSKDIAEVKYFERSNDPELNFQEVSFENLATGIRSIIALVGDILCRFMLNQKDIQTTSDIEGIVIIDELDIHLHPKWQRDLPKLLSDVFPKIQFIASTHSPIPLLGAPKGSVFLKVIREVANGIIVERLTEIERNLPNMLPNIIYTSELFDMDSIRSVANENETEILTQDNINEAEEFIAAKKRYTLEDINDDILLKKLKNLY